NMINGTRTYYRGDGTWTEDRNQADVVVSTSSGMVTFKDVPLGNYFIQEIEAPQGYQVKKQPISIQVTKATATPLHFKNIKLPRVHRLEITKLDADNPRVTLRDAEFVLYRERGGQKEYYNSENGVTSWEASEVRHRSDRYGHLYFDKLETGT
ncbi:prealbumin-like fold domain-containing protein, partial [Erysipelothrix rhusiopathiae]|nr:prealbumin-like fold domain-containing protein [Erysipelothrix rhusiopathiae]